MKMKIRRNFQSYSSPWLTRFPFAKMPKEQWGRETWLQSWRFLLHMANHLFFTVTISTSHSKNILVHFVRWLFSAMQTLAKQELPNYQINTIFSSKLSLDSFFFQHRSFETLWGRLHYTLTV